MMSSKMSHKTRILLFIAISLISLNGIYATNGTDGNHFRGIVIRVPGYNSRPSMIMVKHPDGNFSYSGYNKDFIDIFSKYIGMKYEIVNVNETEIVSKGFAEAMLNQLRRNEVDFNYLGFVPTAGRMKEFDLTIPIYAEQCRFLVKYPEEESRLWAPLRPFQLPVWIILFFTLIAIDVSLSLVMLLVREVNHEIGRRHLTFLEFVGDNAIYICTIIASQAEYVRERKLPVRILIAMWCLMALILINSYTGNLISYLTVPKLSPVVNSFEELAYKRKTGLVLEAKYVLTEQILSATSGPYKEIGDSIRSNPKLLIKHPDEAGPTMHQYNVPWLTTSYAARFAIGMFIDECRFTQSELLPLSQFYTVALRKNLPYFNYVNSKLYYMLENGLFEKLRQNYSPRIGKCLINKNQKPKTQPLKLIDYSSAFVLLGFGLGLATFAFLLEIIAKFSYMHRN